MGLTSPSLEHQASIVILHFYYVLSLCTIWESVCLYSWHCGSSAEVQQGQVQPRSTSRGASRPSARVFEFMNIFPCCQVYKAVERADNENGGNTNSETIQLDIQLRKGCVFILNVSTCHSHPAFGTQNAHWACSRCSSGVSQVVHLLLM